MSLIASWLASPPPDAALEISAERVSAAVVTRRGRGAVVEAFASEALPGGAIAPSLTAGNIADRPQVIAAVRTVLSQIGTRPRRIALVVPDVTAKVSLVRFDQLPSRREDLDQLVRWQTRKSAPFPVEDACLTYTTGRRGAEGTELVVAMARRDVVREYETICEDAGVYAGLVDLATFSLINWFLASAESPVAGDWLVVHMRPDYTSLVIMRGDDVIFFRNRPEGETESLADLVHQTAMYYEDRLTGSGFSRVLLGGEGRMAGAADAARGSLEQRLGVKVDSIDPTRSPSVTLRARAVPQAIDGLAPLIGMMLRTEQEAVSA